MPFQSRLLSTLTWASQLITSKPKPLRLSGQRSRPTIYFNLTQMWSLSFLCPDKEWFHNYSYIYILSTEKFLHVASDSRKVVQSTNSKKRL